MKYKNSECGVCNRGPRNTMVGMEKETTLGEIGGLNVPPSKHMETKEDMARLDTARQACALAA
jgi:hypothetical protein